MKDEEVIVKVYLSEETTNILVKFAQNEYHFDPQERREHFSYEDLDDLICNLNCRDEDNYIYLNQKQLNWVMCEADWSIAYAHDNNNN